MKQTIQPDLKHIKPIWTHYFREYKKKLVFSLLYLIAVLVALPNFLQFIEERNGYSFNDPVLALYQPVDVTWLTFCLIYSALLIAVIHFSDKPKLFHCTMLAYALMATTRIIAMYLLPLNPPDSMILLNDPFVQFFGSGEILTKDLFFSGHTSTLFLLFLVSEQRALKYIFLLATILVAICVVLQHVHYTIDVFAAPFFAYASYKIANRIIKRN